jgi:hypothetical protein
MPSARGITVIWLIGGVYPQPITVALPQTELNPIYFIE